MSIPYDVQRILEKEKVYFENIKNPFAVFAHKIKINEMAVKDWLKYSKEKGLRTYVLGASTKGNTLLQVWGLTNKDFSYALEVNSAKFGLYTVGSDISIISEKKGLALKPDQLFILPWHFVINLKAKLKDYLADGGMLVTPLPHFSRHFEKEGYQWVLEQKVSVF